MKWKSLRRDEGVKPVWKKGMNYFFYFLVGLYILRFLLRLKDRIENKSSAIAENLVWVVLVLVILFIISGIVYLIKPSWFMVNKEQNLEVSDTENVE